MRECDTKIPFSITPLLPILVGIILGVVIGFNLEFWWIVFAIVGIVLTYFSKQKTTTLIFISVVLGWVNVSFQSPNLIDDSHLNKTMTFSGVASSIKTSDEIIGDGNFPPLFIVSNIPLSYIDGLLMY